MPKIRSLIECTIDPLDPVEEISEVIGAVLTGYDAPRRLQILNDLEKKIQITRSELEPKLLPKTEA